MTHRKTGVWCGVVAVLVGACSDSGPADPDGRLEIRRESPGFARIETKDTLDFSVRRRGDPVSPEEVGWSSSDPLVLRLLAPGRFVADNPGSATVIATGRRGEDASATVEVREPLAAAIRLPPGPIELLRTERVPVVPTPLDRKGNPINGVREEIVLASRDPAVAEVAPGSTVRGVSVGETRIVASFQGVEAEVGVRVREMPPLVLDAAVLRLRLPGDAGRLTGTVEGEARAVESLRVVEEARWLDERGVVRIAGDTVVALAPGSARVEARAPLALPDTLEVRVEPDGPTVYFGPPPEPVAGGSPAELRGWGLDDPGVTAVRVGGLDAQILFRDSATIRISAPVEEPGECVGDARRRVAVAGAEVVSGVELLVARPDELQAAPGQAVDVEAGDCVKLPADPEARWALAATDGEVWSVVDRPVVVDPEDQEPVELVLGDGGRAGGSSMDGTVDVGAARPGRRGGTPLADPTGRGLRSPSAGTVRIRPYEVGDTVRLGEGGLGPLNPEGLYRALEIVRDRYVLFFREGERSVPDSVVGRIRQAVDTMDMTLRPLLDPVVSESPQDEFGQFAVFVRWDPGTLGVNGLGGLTSIWLSVQDRLRERLHHTLLHEVAHSYQARIRADERAAGRSGGAYRPWSWEGLADFTAYEVRRRVYDLSWNANLPLDAAGLEFLTEEGRLQGGPILFGYGFSAGLFRELARRWAGATGGSVDDAVREVFRAGALGWWGCRTEVGACTSRGLAEELASIFGTEVDPSEVILDWALAQAADDRLASPAWRNELFLLASDGWTPATVFVAGAGDVGFELDPGGVEWVEIEDPEGSGTTLRLPPDPRWRWRIIRIR